MQIFVTMKFKKYLHLIKKKPTAWAREKKLSPATIWRAYKEKGFPDPSTIRAIEEASAGAVKPEDWY